MVALILTMVYMFTCGYNPGYLKHVLFMPAAMENVNTIWLFSFKSRLLLPHSLPVSEMLVKTVFKLIGSLDHVQHCPKNAVAVCLPRKLRK